MPALTGEQHFALESGLALLDQDQVDRVIALVGDAAWTDENGIDVNIGWFKLSAEKQRDLVHLVDTMLIGKNTMSARTNINRLVQLTADEQKAFLHKAVGKLFDMSPDEPRKFQMLALASNVITDEWMSLIVTLASNIARCHLRCRQHHQRQLNQRSTLPQRHAPRHHRSHMRQRPWPGLTGAR